MATGVAHDRPSLSTVTSDQFPASPATAAAGRSNALSARITSVLSASYADLEIRNALETLDARGVQNTQDTRRNLRHDIQKEVIQCNGEIIQDFGQVAEQLRRIGNAISSLNTHCQAMRTQISASNRETAPVLEDANTLLTQKSQAETKQKLLSAFNAHFLVSEEELTILTSTAEPVDDSFFKILGRVKRIHADSQLLLGTEDQRLGLEILEQSSKNLNAAYQKLFRWIQREFKTLDLENPQISSSIRRSLRVLAERPTLFQNCLDFFAEAREHTLSDSFYAALTGTTSAEDVQRPSVKPIDFQAHDPVRYTGDMLAWAHSATVSEREALEVLFIAEGEEIAKGIKTGRENEPWTKPEGDEEIFDGRKALADLVSRNLSGVARLLKQRVEQTIHAQEEATVVYKIANLVGFYNVTFKKVFGEGTAMLDVLNELEVIAIRDFKSLMRDHIASLQSEFSGTPDDLAPPEFLEEGLESLKILMKSYDTSLAAVDSSENVFDPILAEALDPFLNGCQALYRRIEAPGSDIFAVNCFRAVLSTIAPYSFTAERQEDVEDAIQEYKEKLVKYQHNYFLHTSGLNSLLHTLEARADSEEEANLASLEQFKPQALVTTSQALDEFLPSALMDAIENVKQLREPKMAQLITEEAAEMFCQDFELIESRILKYDEAEAEKENGVDDEGHLRLRDCFPRTSAEVRVLLS